MKTELPPLPPIDGVLGYTRAQMIDYASKAVKLSHAAPAAEEAPQQEPDWKHPMVQSLIAADARNRIVINLIWQILEQPEREDFTAADMEYWDAIHDAVKGAITKQQPAAHGEPVAWIQWTGGKCPIDDDVVFEYFTINGEHHGPTSSASRLDWSHDYHLNNGDIVAYRPCTPQPTPELVQAARQALEALVNHGHSYLHHENQYKDAISVLQNALKGTK